MSEVFSNASGGGAAVIPFVPAGFPCADSTLAMLRTLAEAGADIIEVGVPFSDPMADGTAIQQANMVALENGMTLAGVLSQVQAFRQLGFNTPVVLMGYTNSFVNFGREKFAAAAGAAGVSGVIMVDVDDAEGEQWRVAFASENIDMIRLIAPTTAAARTKKIAAGASGFVYYVALRGITGAGHLDVSEVTQQCERIKQQIALPLAVGFGIQTPEHAAAVGAVADGVVVGSALVRLIQQSPPQQTEAMLAAVHQFISDIKAAVAEHAKGGAQ